jgi:hypothetical protein
VGRKGGSMFQLASLEYIFYLSVFDATPDKWTQHLLKSNIPYGNFAILCKELFKVSQIDFATIALNGVLKWVPCNFVSSVHKGTLLSYSFLKGKYFDIVEDENIEKVPYEFPPLKSAQFKNVESFIDLYLYVLWFYNPTVHVRRIGLEEYVLQ